MSNNNWNENNQNNNGETDSTYSYSYLNKEQKDPNNTWREEPHNWNTTGQAREVNKDDWRAQNNQQDGYAGNSQYSHFYTNPDAEPKKQKKQRKHRAGNSGNGGQKGGFGRLVGKVVVCAVIFGLVAGGIMTGMNVLTQKDNSTEATASVSSDDGTQDDIVLNTGNKVSTTDTNVTATATDVSQIVENAMPSIPVS
jgi:serine protease Do